MFITMEGGEGCGKTTQIKLLADSLRDSGKKVTTTREPGGCLLAESIRNLLLSPENTSMCYKTEFLLFCAARAQHIQDTVAPALADNQIVICDRYIDSTWVYQLYARGIIFPDTFKEITYYAITYKGVPYIPDITFILDIDVEVGHSRALARNGVDCKEARFDNEHINFHRKVNAGFLARANHAERFVLIDANKDITTVHKEILHQLQLRGGKENGY